MAGQKGNLSFNEDRLDLFYYFLAECKRLGLYWIFNPQSFNLYLDMNGANNRFDYTDTSNCKSRIYTEQDVRDNWRLGFDKLYNRINPYTGINI